VEISYKSRKLEKQLTKPKELVKSFGSLARKVNQRMKDLSDADNLAIMRTIPAANCLSINQEGIDIILFELECGFNPFHLCF